MLVGDEVNFDGAPQERGSASFSNVTLETQEDVANFLNGDSPESVAARARVEAALADKPGELERALSGEGYVPVQFTVAVQYFGTTYFNGSDVIVAGDPRQTEPDDILWVFITEEGIIVSKASIRADCANPEFEYIIPKRPETPPAPPIDVPPCLVNCEPPPVCPPEMPYGTPPICKDGPENNISQNPNVPPQVKGPGCPHQEYVGGPCVPSPVQRPEVDTPTGCIDSCEEDDGFPPTTTTTRPPSTTVTTVPSCGQQGQPSCGNTGVTTPPTTQPPAPPPQDDPNEGIIVSP